VCGKENPALQCEQCHFDGSCHYEAFPTLLPVRAGTAAISRLRQKAGDVLQSPDSGSSKRSLPKWLIPVGAAAILLLGLTIGFVFGSNRAPLPKESQGQTDLVQADPVQTDAEQSDTASLPTYFMASGDILQGNSEKEDVHTISFCSTLDGAPANAWDVSAENNRSILAWMDGNDLIVAANGIISLPKNSSYLFADFVNVTRIDFGDSIDTSNVTYMSWMFSDCDSLTTLDLSGFDTSNVMDMAYMFEYCNALTSLDLSGFDTSNVTNMADMFAFCNALATLDLSGFDTSNVTNMSLMFDGCSALTTLDLSGFDASNVTNTAWMFNGCSALTTLICEDEKILEEYQH